MYLIHAWSVKKGLFYGDKYSGIDEYSYAVTVKHCR